MKGHRLFLRACRQPPAGGLGLAPNPRLIERVKASDLVVWVGGRIGEIPSQGYRLFDIPSLADVQPGDKVLTAGIDGIYPKGIPVGTVVKAEKGPELFKNIRVKPSVDFGSIEEVIIIHTRKIPSAVVGYAP